MMAMAGQSYGRFDIPRVLNRTFRVIGSNPVTFLALAVLLSLPAVAIDVWLTTSMGMAGGGLGPVLEEMRIGVLAPAVVVAVFVIGFIVYWVFASLLQGAITHATIAALNDRKASLGECFTTGVQNALPLVAISFLASLGFVLGLILFIVPGIMLLVTWAVLAPVRVAERTSIMETFGRSADLTSGYRWRILLLFIIYAVLARVTQVAFLPILGMSMVSGNPNSFTMAYVAMQAVQQIVLGLISATGIASIYYELRTIKEGIGPEQLAAVFA